MNFCEAFKSFLVGAGVSGVFFALLIIILEKWSDD